VWTIERIAQAVEGAVHRPDLTREITGFCIDSRLLKPGEFFIALAGQHTDGHLFLKEAFQKGASGALVRQIPAALPRELYNCIKVPDTLQALQRLASAYRRQCVIPIVGITGSSGKTTTKELLYALLSRTCRTYRSPGNYNTEIGLPVALLNMPATTEVGVFELALQGPGEIRTLSQIAQPTIGVLTSIGEAHLGFFKSREELAWAKWELMENLTPQGVAVLNFDAPFLPSWAKTLPLRVIGFGLENGRAAVRAKRIRDEAPTGVAFEICTPQEHFFVQTKLLGRANVYNVLAAVAVALEFDASVEQIQQVLAQFRPLPQRMELKESPRYGLILDDSYNANPSSVKEAVHALARLRVAHRKIFVLGDMLELGDFSVELHREMADLIDELDIDRVFTIGKLAREMALALRKREGWTAKRVIPTSSLDELKETMLRELSDDQNLILVKGSRGMRLDELVSLLTASAKP
jgi:UDP-N-acetylmuramoyl-tripeptide--D-alanyl-D-alanine ligase